MSITAPKGFVASGISAGIKESGRPDLSLVATVDSKPVPTAGVFTRNLMTAAPVQISRAHLEVTAGAASAVILNSGNANAGTGQSGRDDASAMCAAVAQRLDCNSEHVLVGSTGLIGIALRTDVIVAAVPTLVAALGASPEAGAAAAHALMTTDTFPKEAVAKAGVATVGGMAKGAAMLAPSMATMLAVLTTDAEADAATLTRVLKEGVDTSFNALLTDGCTSTNDTVLLLASGRAGPVEESELAAAVKAVCRSLAQQMANDAEGATKVVTLTIRGAVSDLDARLGAERISRSLLCKCSWFGCDPYWGRLASELGCSGISFDQDLISISYGGITVASGGVSIDHDRTTVEAHMAGRYLDITCDLGLGTGTATVLTNDLTHAYVDENMGGS